MKMMQAVVVENPMVFSVQQVPVPKTPRDGMLVKVEACGLCGSDLRTLRSGHKNITFPWTIGHEICGTVFEIGEACITSFEVGDRLAIGPLAYCGECEFCRAGRFELCENQREIGQQWQGGLAEYVAIDAACIKLGNIQKVPQGMQSIHAAVIEPISSCVHAQQKANVTLGDTVVIFGAGPIGCIHVALAKARGAFQVFLIDIDETRLQMAAAFGPDRLINALEVDPVETVLSMTNGTGAEVILVATPAPKASVQAVEMAKKGGRIVQFGGLPHNDSKPGIDMNLVHYRGLTILGTSTFAPSHNKIALQLVESGLIPVDKLITHVFALKDFEKGAHLALEGKVLKGVYLP
ncbi:L-iditol 2-dehydrogenase [Sphaerochaeta associata]|uniref:Alcohol dehydrogenase catalytic domain-containing protein n=1 Tax=Sphaerochaeta associata TaxID=1129264 RepID=A0ABY4D8A2_9SPIR|nr:alcohol dehydrogenase catalytic domain-containing protein [Sphaerochaeta associata]UOM49618.1 alcohol dehydrogenase catalytic domain-containing protein [Sphaerochaeta associata]SMP49144.1 L-iditol 2-dehydrogenase [Sphaerochaeta associata]